MSSTPCATCAKEVPTGSKFCSGCGTPRPVEVTAPPAAAVWATVPATQTGAPAVAPPATATFAVAPPPVVAAPAPPQTQPAPHTPVAPLPGPHTSVVPHNALPTQLSASIGPALTMVSTAAALAFGLPGAINALGTYGSNGTKTVLVLLLALTTAQAVVGSVFASIRLKQYGEDPVLGRLVFGLGLFASVFSGLEFIAALAT